MLKRILGPAVVAGLAAALVAPAADDAQEAAKQAAAVKRSQNNLKQLGLAIHNYHDANGDLPRDVTDKNGKPILSWRVLILPYIEQDAVSRLFKLDEAWDSEANQQASKLIIKTFLSPGAAKNVDKDGYGLTNYLGVTGANTAFEGKKLRFADFSDGLSNTILVVESADAMPWAKPGGLAIDAKKALPKLDGAIKAGTTNVLIGDGSVRTLDLKKVSEKTLKAAFTRAGGEVLGEDW